MAWVSAISPFQWRDILSGAVSARRSLKKNFPHSIDFFNFMDFCKAAI
jgi:hypothetical protein